MLNDNEYPMWKRSSQESTITTLVILDNVHREKSKENFVIFFIQNSVFLLKSDKVSAHFTVLK